MIQRLLEIGFRKVGEWKLSAGEVVCALEAEAESRNILYAFESEHEVLYIGKTTQPLNRLLKNPSTRGPS